MELENSMLVIDGNAVGADNEDLTAYQTKTDNSLATTSKTVVGAINEVNTAVGTKQNSTDNSLATTSKTVVGAINEVNSNLSGKQNATDNNLTTTSKTVVGGINELKSELVNKIVTNNLEPSGKVTSVGGNVVRNGQVCFINIGITMSGQETSNWIELGSVPEPAYVVRANFVSDLASSIGTLRIQIDADGKFKVFYGGEAEYRVVMMYLISNGK